MITKIFTVSEKIGVPRYFFIVVLFLSLASCVFAQKATPSPTPDEDVVKISTALIQLDVTVTDKSGKVITDLRQDEIEIYENGQKQDISNFSFISSVRPHKTENVKRDVPDTIVPVPGKTLRPEQIRRTIALVVDDLNLSFESAYQVRRALKKYVDEQMRDGDFVAIMRTGAGVGALQQFTADKRQLYAAIEKVNWNPHGRSGISAFAPVEDLPDSIKQEDAGDKKARENFEADVDDFRSGVFSSGTLGALKYIVNGMSELPGRKSVILFSDGFPILGHSEFGATEAGEALQFIKRLTETANRAAVVFYAIDARGLADINITAQDKISPTPQRVRAVLSGRSRELFDTQQVLVILSKDTGGFAALNKNDLDGSVRDILDDQSYYLVGYQPASETFDARTRRFNKLDVKVKRPGAVVRYRSGFFNVADSPKTTNTGTQAPIQKLKQALVSPFGINKIALRLNTLYGNNATGNFITALLHIDTRDLKFTDGPDGTKRVILDLLAAGFGDDGVPTDNVAKTLTFDIKPAIYEQVLRDGFVCNFTFPVQKPGAYQFRVAVRDAQADTIGSASQFIEIPDLAKGRLNVSGILLENFDADQWRRFSGDAATLPAAAESRAVEPTDPFTDTSIRRFKRGTVLRYGFEAYNAKVDTIGRPKLKARIRVFHDGKIVMDGQALPVEFAGQADAGRIQSGGAIALLKDMPPGEYVLQVIVTDELEKEGRRTGSQFVQFEIIE